MTPLNVSIIVPTYNEMDSVAELVKRLSLLQNWVKEIIIVDGQSQDDTVERLKNQFTVIQSATGRARQMNTGASVASGTWLFFLHADTSLTPSQLQNAVANSTEYQWGRFDVQFDGHHPAFRLVERMINWRSRLTGVATGDQCLFIRASAFNEMNGFADIPLMEDVDLCYRLLKKSGRPSCIDQPVRTSSRRWEDNGILSTIWLMWKLRFQFWRGRDAFQLVTQYYPHFDVKRYKAISPQYSKESTSSSKPICNNTQSH